jgi:hypothetical protein
MQTGAASPREHNTDHTGTALPDGSLPIRSREHVTEAVDLYHDHPPAVVRDHIIARAQALGSSDLIPSHWLTDDPEVKTDSENAPDDDLPDDRTADESPFEESARSMARDLGMKRPMEDAGHSPPGRTDSGARSRHGSTESEVTRLLREVEAHEQGERIRSMNRWLRRMTPEDRRRTVQTAIRESTARATALRRASARSMVGDVYGAGPRATSERALVERRARNESTREVSAAPGGRSMAADVGAPR